MIKPIHEAGMIEINADALIRLSWTAEGQDAQPRANKDSSKGLGRYCAG